MKIKIHYIIFLFVLFTIYPTYTQASPQAIYYVSPTGDDANAGSLEQPFLTIERARQIVQTINDDMSDEIIVYLRGGVYNLSDTIFFNSGDSGTNGFNIVYKAYPGEHPHLSGGQEITNWSSVGNGTYKASGVTSSFRQLYVNNQRAIRAQTPNKGDSLNTILNWGTDIEKNIKINADEIDNWSDLSKVEMVVERLWEISRLRIASFSVVDNQAFIVPAEPERSMQWANWLFKVNGSNYYFENAKEFLDSPGEWYLDSVSHELFYMPLPGENMNLANVMEPRLETLISMQGSLEEPVQNIKFEGIVFEHTNWTGPSNNGYIGLQAGQVLDPAYDTSSVHLISPPSGIYLAGAKKIVFERNIFQHLGGQALQIDGASSDILISGNIVTDISGNGINTDMTHSAPGDLSVCKNIEISNNWIFKIGQDYWDSVGIYSGYVDSLNIKHNDIEDLPYTGISVGWGWLDVPSSLQNNQIKYNHIHSVMKKLSDGAAIYTLGRQPGTIISENYIHDIAPAPNAGYAGSSYAGAVYLDDGSNYITVQNNVVINLAYSAYNEFPWGYANGIHINTELHNLVSQGLEPKSNIISGNDSQSPAVIANAGIEPAYQDIVDAFNAGVSGDTINYSVQAGDLWDNGYDNLDSPRHSTFSRFVFDTNADYISVSGSTGIYNSFPSYAHLGIIVNGVEQEPLTFNSNNSQDFDLFLGTFGVIKRVEIIDGLQSKPANTVIGSFVDGVTYPNGANFEILPPENPTERLLVYGDSISVGGNAINAEYNAYVPLLRNSYGRSVMLEGWGYRSLYEDTNVPSTRSAFVNRLSEYSPSIIWLAIGTNDYGLNKWSAINFGTAYAITLDDMHSAMPTATIICQTPLLRSSEVSNSFGNTLGEYRNQISSICNNRPWTKLVDGTGLLSLSDLADGVHPNTAGHAKYALAINDYLISLDIIAPETPSDLSVL